MDIFTSPIYIFLIALFIQLIFIFVFRKKNTKDLTPEEEYKKSMKIIIKIIFAIVISFIISIASFYGMGILTLIGLQQGR